MYLFAPLLFLLSFQTYDSALAFVREKNTGLSLQGKTCGEHMADLVYVGDETGVQACDGNVHVISAAPGIRILLGFH